MSDPDHQLHQLRFELHRLNKRRLYPVIERICLQFAGYPFDFDEHAPAMQIMALLRTMPFPATPSTASERMANRDLKQALSSLECWTYRAALQTRLGLKGYWNPLEQSFAEYELAHQDEPIAYYRTDCEYPPKDVVYAWVVMATLPLVPIP